MFIHSEKQQNKNCNNLRIFTHENCCNPEM